MPDWYGEYDLPEERQSSRGSRTEGGAEDFSILCMAIMFALPIVGIFYPEVYYPWEVEWALVSKLGNFLLKDAGGQLLLALFFATMIPAFFFFCFFLVFPILVACFFLALLITVAGGIATGLRKALKPHTL